MWSLWIPHLEHICDAQADDAARKADHAGAAAAG